VKRSRLARKAGVDPAKVREALLGGFAASKVLEVHGERILNGNYKPGFRAKLYGKDYRVATETLAAHQVPAPVSAEVNQLVTTPPGLRQGGHGLLGAGDGALRARGTRSRRARRN
jgi:2-hydroxy-3-oxopropionate reductase